MGFIKIEVTGKRMMQKNELQISKKIIMTYYDYIGIKQAQRMNECCEKPITSLMMMVPSMASFRSVRVVLTVTITRCMRSISCLRKIFKG